MPVVIDTLKVTRASGQLRITVPEKLRKPPDTIIELEFAGPIAPGTV